MLRGRPFDVRAFSNAVVALLLAVYAKNEQEDLERRQRQILAQLVKSEFP